MDSQETSNAPAEHRNGRARGVFDITNVTPMRRTVRINGRELQGHVRGPGCKRAVEAEYRAAMARYQHAVAQRAELGPTLTSSGAITALLPELAQINALTLQDSEAAYGRFLALGPTLDRALQAPVADDPVAWSEFVTEALMLVVPGLSLDEAELIDEQTSFRLLRHLEWFVGGPTVEAGDAADPPGTVTSES